MITPNRVTVFFTYESPAGAPVTVSPVSVRVYGQSGASQYLSPAHPSIIESGATYTVSNIDVTGYGGYFVDALWRFRKPGQASPLVESWTKHSFLPGSINFTQANVLQWSASPGLFYVEKRASPASSSFVGVTAYQLFADNNLNNETTYGVYRLLTGAAGSPSLGNEITPTVVPHNTPMCVIGGTISSAEISVRFIVHHNDTINSVGSIENTMWQEISAPIGADGSYAIAFPQGTILVAEIPALGHARRFIVPNADFADLSSIPYTSLEIYRAP